MPDVFQDKEEEKLQIMFEWTVTDIEHFWMAIADYNGYRIKDHLEPLDVRHPLMRAQYRITASVDELISEGMKAGKFVGPLLKIKEIISSGDDFSE